MPVDYDNIRNGNVELGTDWTVQTANGLHIYRAASERMGKEINWMRADNIAGIGPIIRVSKSMPNAGQDGSISREWRSLFRLLGDNHFMFFWVYCNDAALDFTVAGATGYLCQLHGSSSSVRLYKSDGAGVLIDIGGGPVAFPNAAGEHEIIATREVSGANRNWRVYIDRVLLIGPVNDITYATGTYFGFGADGRHMMAEFYIQS